MKLLFLRRSDCGHSARAEAYLRLIFAEVRTAESSGPDDGLPPVLAEWNFDAIFAFRSHIIVRSDMLAKARISLNFHPGPPERPGTGCVNFALLEGDQSYGSTCHHMSNEIDAGPIVDVRRFRIFPDDDVASVLSRTYDHMLCQLYDVAEIIAEGRTPEILPVKWARRATRKSDMDALREIAPDISPGELDKRIRATSFASYRPYIVLHGRRFVLDR
jgi:methionyl-tRNA formyltransferase